MRPVSFFSSILLFILSAHTVLAATIHVPSDQPNIQAGINVAVDGDLVLVSSGTYVENVDFSGKAITVRGESGAEDTIIDGDQNGSGVLFTCGESRESVLDGFTVRNGTGTHWEVYIDYWYHSGGGIFCANSSSPMIINCTISDNICTIGGGVAFTDSSSATITNCTIVNNSAGTSNGIGGGICCVYSSPTITSCKIFKNDAPHSGGGIYFEESSPTITNCLVVENNAGLNGGGICVEDSPSSTIVNCTISANKADGTGDGIDCDGPSPAIANSIIWGNYLSEIWGGSHPPQISYSDIMGGWPGEGNIDEDPLFLKESGPSHPGEWDYHVYLSSPCVDSGTDAGVPTDLEGRFRPLRAGFDMGAYEYPDCVDGDEDGYGDQACGGHDCDDTAPSVNPGAQEVCDNGIDDDCDGLADMEDLQCGDILVPSQFPTIQEGIDAAPEGSVVLVSPGTYFENIKFHGKAITLKGEAGAEMTVIDGGQIDRVVRFEWAETEESVLDGFTITNGGDSKYGGGINCGEATSPVIKNCIITRNQTWGMSEGAGIRSYYSSPTILNCVIKENWTDPRYDGEGAGIYNHGGLTIKNCTIIGNISSRAGRGGGICCGGSLVIEDSLIAENTGGRGGGIYISGSHDPPPSIIRCTITGNVVTDMGGGIYCYKSPGITVDHCTITENIAKDEDGGGIYCTTESDLILTNSIVSRNQAPGSSASGGGINLGGQDDSHIANCIITENYSGRDGGGIDLTTSSTLIENCTIAWNMAGSRGGGVCSSNSYYTIMASIIWGNSAPAGPSIGLHGNGVTASYSDIQGGEEAVAFDTGTVTWLEGMIDEDPLFLGEEDYRLSLGSPCIDAGHPESYNPDACFPPSMGAIRNDMGAYGGPGACGWCGDHDGDGHESVVCGGDDCNDAYAAAYPGAEEVCDGLDTDCDGIVPVEEIDADGDRWLGCLGDCDDTDSAINPFAEEICDGRDNECNGVIDDRDVDEDGYIDEACGGQDCDDSDPSTNPGAPELCDGLDNNCDGFLRIIERDLDQDGWMICWGDCDDSNPLINPLGQEICDAIDWDCTGDPFDKDADRDGYIDTACGGDDCIDSDPSTHPGAPEICDGKDTDCDGTFPVDEADDDLDGWLICEGDCEDTDPIMNPGLDEICGDGKDNDCNGLVDGEEWTICPLVEIETFYLTSILQIDFTLATPEPATWSTLMILTSPTFQLIPLWSVSIIAIGPPIKTIISFPFPGLGWVGIYSALETDGGDQGYDFEWVDTG